MSNKSDKNEMNIWSQLKQRADEEHKLFSVVSFFYHGRIYAIREAFGSVSSSVMRRKSLEKRSDATQKNTTSRSLAICDIH